MTKKSIPRISETEWEIMRIIWAKHPATAAEIIAQLTHADSSWHPKTAKTLLARLVAKGALGYESRGRAYVYQPLVAEKDCIDTASRSFLNRVFGGSLTPMLAHFVEAQKMTPQELREMEELLARKRKQK
jgi:BlaI family penicillinase repressor